MIAGHHEYSASTCVRSTGRRSRHGSMELVGAYDPDVDRGPAQPARQPRHAPVPDRRSAATSTGAPAGDPAPADAARRAVHLLRRRGRPGRRHRSGVSRRRSRGTRRAGNPGCATSIRAAAAPAARPSRRCATGRCASVGADGAARRVRARQRGGAVRRRGQRRRRPRPRCTSASTTHRAAPAATSRRSTCPGSAGSGEARIVDGPTRPSSWRRGAGAGAFGSSEATSVILRVPWQTYPIDLDARPRRAARRASSTSRAKIPRALEALGPIAGRDVLLLDGADGIRARQLAELGAGSTFADADATRAGLDGARRDRPMSWSACWSRVPWRRPPDELAEAARVLRPGGRLLVVHDYGRDDVSRLRGGPARVRPAGAAATGRSCAAASRSGSSTASGRSPRLEEAADVPRPRRSARSGARSRPAMTRPRLSYNVAVYHRDVGSGLTAEPCYAEPDDSRTVPAGSHADDAPRCATRPRAPTPRCRTSAVRLTPILAVALVGSLLFVSTRSPSGMRRRSRCSPSGRVALGIVFIALAVYCARVATWRAGDRRPERPGARAMAVLGGLAAIVGGGCLAAAVILFLLAPAGLTRLEGARPGPSARLRPAAPPSSRGLGRHPFKVEIRGSNPLGGTNSDRRRRRSSPTAAGRSASGVLLPSPAMEIMGIHIPTVDPRQRRATLRRLPRADRRDALAGQPPRHRRHRDAARLDGAPGRQPGPVPVPPRPGPRPRLDAREGLPLLPARPGPRDHATGRRSPARRPSAGGSATASTATTTSSSRPDRRSRAGPAGPGARVPRHSGSEVRRWTGTRCCQALSSALSLVFAVDAPRPVARAPAALPARLGARDALVRPLRRHGVPRLARRSAGASRSTAPGT